MTKLNVKGLLKDVKPVGPGQDGTFSNIGARGGTELMMEGLRKGIDPELMEKFNIICSRVRWLDKNKPNILYLHDTWDDPENEHLKDPKQVARFKKLIFVSHHQQQTFVSGLGVPYSKGVVLQNAIYPFEPVEKDKGPRINLIYHTTPHRGLGLLIPVIEYMTENTDHDIHLDVFSSFEIYGWKQRDEQYKEIFDRCRKHPNITYHGYQPNEVVREALTKAHIFAYPCIWPETSGISVIEAMSAGVQVVCPNFGALPETTAGFATMYGFDEDINRHANIFANVLNMAINAQWDDSMQHKLRFQKLYADQFYNWNQRIQQWDSLLRSFL